MMLDKSQQLYHCENCGAVFRSEIRDVSELRCTECGESPVRSGFSNLSQLPMNVESSNGFIGYEEHSLGGEELARRSSSRRELKKKSKGGRSVMLVMVVLVVLISVFGYSYFGNSGENGEIVAKHDSTEEFEIRSKKAGVACLKRFLKFVRSNGYGEMSEHVCNKNDHLRRMQQHYSNVFNRERGRNSKLEMTEWVLSEEDSTPRLDTLIDLNFGGSMSDFSEAVFWKVNDEWLLDWAHYVRSGDLDWSTYG